MRYIFYINRKGEGVSTPRQVGQTTRTEDAWAAANTNASKAVKAPPKEG